MSRPTLQQIAQAFREDRFDAAMCASLASDPRVGVQVFVRRFLAQQEAARVEAARIDALWRHERALWKGGVTLIAGVDEVGMGPLAGPVVAAAVILPLNCDLPGIDDSKKVPANKREGLDALIKARAIAWALGHCTAREIDSINIYAAGRLAMQRAVMALLHAKETPAPQHLLVDARVVPGTTLRQTAIVHGDAESVSIAAASIIAKVARDAHMQKLEAKYPGYQLGQHMGYATPFHMQALTRLGPTPIHRQSFSPVAAAAGARGARVAVVGDAGGVPA